MALPEDPRGSRRGQTGNDPAGDRRDPRQLTQRPASRPPASRPQQDDQFASFGASAPQRDFQERPAANGRQQQPSFSNYRPEAYANNDKRGARAPERQEWQQPEPQFRAEAPAPRPAVDAFSAAPAAERSRQQHHDPYSAGGDDPYDVGRREYEASNDWHASPAYEDQQSNQYASNSFYQQHEEPQPAPDAQSMHDRFFAAVPEPERPRAPQAQPQPAPVAPRYQANDFGDEDFQPEERPVPRAAKPTPAPAPARGGFEENDGDYRWDNFDQQPAPETVRPFNNAKMPPAEEDLDADYFADEEDFEGDDDYAEPKRGSKRLMAAVLVGAVVTGGGLAYMYKAQVGGGDSGEPPIIAANTLPVKEKPADPGGREFPNGSKLIYDRLDGSAGPEEPTRLAATDANADRGSQGGGSQGVVTTTGSGTLEERIQNALRDAKRQDDPPTASSNGASALDTPRPVRTETIRPDGTTDSARVQRRQAPADGDTTLAAGAPRGVVAREAPAAEPAPRRQQVAAATPTAPATAVSVTPTVGGEPGMFVQIAARNDEAAAKAAFQDLKQKYSGVLGDHSPSVRKVDLGEKGVWFRLLVGPMANKAEADKLCDDLKTAGMKGCFSRKE